MSKYNRYSRLRQDTYQKLGNAKDATFDLMDSIMTTRNAYCIGDFSLSPFFRRKWHSTYEAVQDCRPDRNQLMKRGSSLLGMVRSGGINRLNPYLTRDLID